MQVIVNRVCCLFLIVLAFSSVSNAERMVIPLVASGKQVYLATEVELIEKEKVRQQMGLVRSVGDDFLKLVKNNNQKDTSLFSEKDGSALKWLDPKVYQQYAGFTKVDKTVYKDPILWGGYLHAPTIYNVGSNEVLWREDYLCLDDECKKSLYDFGQLFEVSYKNYVKNPKDSYIGNVEKEIVESKRRQFFDMSSFLPSEGREGPKFKVGMAISQIKGNACVLCEEQVEYADSFEKNLLSKFRDFNIKLIDVDVFDSESLTPFLKLKEGVINSKKGIPIIKWVDGNPKLTHIDHSGFLHGLQAYADGKLEGYILDNIYAYLFVSREANEDKQFQIFVLKKNSQNEYDLFPHTDKELESRALMFDSYVLSLLSKVLGI